MLEPSWPCFDLRNGETFFKAPLPMLRTADVVVALTFLVTDPTFLLTDPTFFERLFAVLGPIL